MGGKNSGIVVPDEIVTEKCRAALVHVASGSSMRNASELVGVAFSTMLSWLSRPEWNAQYAHAISERASALAERGFEVANDPNLDPQDRRVRLDAVKWFTSKLDPKRFGDKVVQQHVGHDGGAIKSQHAVIHAHVAPSDAYLQMLGGAVREIEGPKE